MVNGVGGVMLECRDPRPEPRMVVARPGPALRDHVSGYAGLHVEAARPLNGRAVPTCTVALFIDFTASVRLITTPTPAYVQASHVTGLHDGILRFQRAAQLLTRSPGGTLPQVATACGYADQAHFNREFRRLAGCTPTAFRAEHAAATTASRGQAALGDPLLIRSAGRGAGPSHSFNTSVRGRP